MKLNPCILSICEIFSCFMCLLSDFQDNIRGCEKALEYLCKWETEVNQSGIDLPVYATVCNWLPYIMNFFHYRITNGKTEGRNNLIRQIDRMGFHYGHDSLQGCIYAHDRRQEYIKWQNHLRDKEAHDMEVCKLQAPVQCVDNQVA